MDRIERAFRLLYASWQVLKKDRELVVLPIISGVLTILVAGGCIVAAVATGYDPELENQNAFHYALLGLFYFSAYFISIFFTAAVVAAAMMRLNGEDPTVRDGLSRALERTGALAGWALLASTVGLLLRSLEQRFGILGRIVVGLIGAAWSVITYFVVPVIMFEPVGAYDGVKRSGAIFKQRWGETLVGSGGIGLATVLISIPLIALSIALGVVVPVAGILLGVVGFVGLLAIGSTLNGIYMTALYRYATEGAAPAGFNAQDLSGSFREPRRRFGGGPRIPGTPGGFAG